MDDDKILKELYSREESSLEEQATRSRQGVRRRSEPLDIRPIFSRDADRILHSLCFTRYIDKTQVFYDPSSDHITHRVIHVQIVSKIARQIAGIIRLNENLVEAIALGHDVGHSAFGHDGEKILSDLCQKNGIGEFHHAVQGIRFLDQLEKRERIQKDASGLNLTLQVLDGILCHDGEADEMALYPDWDKDWATFDKQTQDRQKGEKIKLMPMTLEGCLVRLADTISYIGRDFEDAILLGLIKRLELPEACQKILGQTNRTIQNTLIRDVIRNSKGKNHVTYSQRVFDALIAMKNFNRERICFNPAIKTHIPKITDGFQQMFKVFLRDLKEDNRDSVIFRDHVKLIGEKYLKENKSEEIVRDCIAGQTDKYFMATFERYILPKFLRGDLD